MLSIEVDQCFSCCFQLKFKNQSGPNQPSFASNNYSSASLLVVPCLLDVVVATPLRLLLRGQSVVCLLSLSNRLTYSENLEKVAKKEKARVGPRYYNKKSTHSLVSVSQILASESMLSTI